MPLRLIVGPPNSGRAGEVRRRFLAAAARDPLLVVPTREDAERLERELCAAEGGGPAAVLGGAVLTFGWLFDEVARSVGADCPPLLTDAQRLQLVRTAIGRCELRALERSGAQAGFAPAIAGLIDELEGAGVAPDELSRRVAEQGGLRMERELCELFAAYRSLCAELGRADSHDLAAASIAGLRRDPGAWAGRPVLLYGFDDLTAEQLELIRVLSEAGEVTVAVTYEDRPALAARAGLLAELRELGETAESSFDAEPDYTSSPALFHIERHLFEPEAARVRPDDGLRLLEAGGPLAEAEGIAAEIARLLAAGERPEDIVVVLRAPDAAGPFLGRVLERLGIPVAVEGRIPIEATATGRGLLALLEAVHGERRAADVLAFLRTPGRARPDDVDWLERGVRRHGLRSAEEAIERWYERDGRPLWELEAVSGGQRDTAFLGGVARVAASIAERPLQRAAALPDRAREIELRAGSAIRAALAELAALPGPKPSPGALVEALRELRLPLWVGPLGGRVRVVSPYRVRAGRARHLFVASLQDGEFPAHTPLDPLLAPERREALGLPARRDPGEEERYLFHACVSRPTERLYLSYRTSDEEGRAALPSPFLDDVLDLIAAEAADGPAPLRTRRGLDRVVFSAAEAPTAAELARAIAALGPAVDAGALLRDMELPPELAARVAGEARDARKIARPQPGPLTVPGVIEELAARRLFGASTLEEYLVCSYRWFVRHELRPQPIEPPPEPMAQGGIVHSALERLYRERPGGTATPSTGSLEAWRRRAAELIEETARERGWALDQAGRARVSAARMIALVERFLADEAQCETPLEPAPELLEAAFGERDDDDRPPLDLGSFRLHGRIDRVDVPAGEARAGLVHDYKLSRKVTRGASLEKEGKLQLQLYAVALRELWGLDPLGGVYHPLGATRQGDRRARGFLDGDEKDGLLAGVPYVGTDFVPHEDLEEILAAARKSAAVVVDRMRRGRVTRDPRDDKCPTWCVFQPICRRERAVLLDPELEEAE